MDSLYVKAFLAPNGKTGSEYNQNTTNLGRH